MIFQETNICIYLLSSKKLLPDFIKDSTITINRLNDTIVNEEDNYAFDIIIKDKYINIGAELIASKGKTSNYNLFISKKTYLPTEFIKIFPDKKGSWSSSFTNISLSALRPDSIWEMNKLPKKYLRLSKEELAESFKNRVKTQIGQKAPDWKLPILNSRDSIQLPQQKGSLVLLEFWFPYCTGCVKAIASINEIDEAYSNKGLKVYGIEFGQSNNTGLKEYTQKQKFSIRHYIQEKM